MNNSHSESRDSAERVLVLGGTGRTGRRVAAGLGAKGISVRVGSRGATPPFDWNDEAGWDACLDGVDATCISYAPDLAMPGATDAVRAFVDRATQRGVQRLVLLSGRGEPEAQACEGIVQGSGVEWTVVRASWFFQKSSEGAFTEMVLTGRITLPAGAVAEPFVDVDDIAEVAIAALSESGHGGEVYEVTGPRLPTFSEVASELTGVNGREIDFIEVPHDAFIEGAKQVGSPQDVVWMLDCLFATVLDGRNAHITDGVQRALGREPKDFLAYAGDAAATYVWNVALPVGGDGL